MTMPIISSSLPSRGMWAYLLIVLLVIAHANAAASQKVIKKKQNKPPFKPGPWKDAHATFYEGGSTTFGGACAYDDVEKEGYGMETAALSDALFNNGTSCGACFEIKCVESTNLCKPGQPSLIVTGTNRCPPNSPHCNPPLEHFDIAKPVFQNIADYKSGLIPITYRRVPCKKKGGIRFTVTGNPYFNEVLVWNVGGAGDVTNVQVKGNSKLKWTDMTRHWGQKWVTNSMMVGETLTFRVRTSDGKFSTSWHIAPTNWQFGQTFEGKNFK